jgi:hypothetical protein
MTRLRKNYSSYEEINLDLEILRTERDIAFHKIKKSFSASKDEIKESIAPINVLKSGFQTFKSNKSSSIKAIIISALIKFMLNKLKK